MTHQYLLQVEFGEDTSFSRDEAVFVHQVKSAAAFYSMAITKGPLPQVVLIRVLDKEDTDLSKFAKNEC